MAKQTIVTKLNTNLGGDALQEVRSKGLRPASPELLLKTKGAEAITTTPPAVVGEKIVNIEDNYSKYFGRPPMIFSAADEAILRDQRADAQSTLGILAKGTGKLIGKGILHGLGAFSTIPIMLTAIPFTAGAAAVEGIKSLSQGKSYDPTKAGNMFASFYDNALSKALDKGVEGLDNLMPIYKTQREQNAKFWSFENIASTKFLAEDFFGGMSFLLGNYIGGAGVGGVVRSFGLASKAMKKASQIKRALSAEDFVNIALRGKVLDSRITAAGQTLLAGYEAGIQARQFRESALEDFKTKYIAENLRNPTDEIMAEFSDNITATANGIFMANMLLTSVDNVVMFNKTFGRPLRDSIGLVNKKGKLAGLRAAAAGEEAADIATRLIPPSRLGHVLKTSGSFLLKPVYEGTQEFLQEVFNQAGIKYVLSKYSPEGHDNNYGFMKNMSAAFGEAFKETYNSEEAMKEAYIGLLLGLVGIPGIATGSIKEIREVFRKPQVSQYSIDYHKFNTGNVLKGVASNLSRQYEIARDKEKAMRNNDFLAAKDEDAKEFLSWMSSRFNVGLLNEEIDRYIDTLDKMTNDEFKEELGNNNLNDAEIKERKEHIKKSILRNRKSFIKAKNLSDRIVSNSIEESKREDLEDLITFTIFMSEDANNRLNDINETIKQNTGLSLMDENENGNVLNYFDSDGNIIDVPGGASTAKLRAYASNPNNYMELATMIKDHEILTRKKDAYSDLIKKFYDVKAQVSFADNLAQKKFDIFRKFAHAVSITKKYELLKSRLEVAKQQLEAELKVATDPKVIADIENDLIKVNDKIVEVTNKIKQRFPVTSEMQTFAMMVNAMVEGNAKATEIVSPTAIETIDDLNLITKIGASAKGRASIGTIGGGTAVNKVYYPGEDSPLGEVPEGTSVTIYEIDENNTPLVYSINRYNVKQEKFVQSFFKTNEERKPVPFNYDDFVIFLKSLSDTGIEFKDINKINIDNFVNFSIHDSLNEGLYIIVNAVDPTTGAESKNRFNTTTHDDLSDSAEITEKIVERFTKRNELLLMIPESNEEARYTALVSNEQSLKDFDNDATIEDFNKYNFKIITSDSESEPGIVLVTLKATVKNEFLSEPDIVTEEEFTVSIYTNKFEFEGPLKDKYEKQKEDLNKQISKALSVLGRRKEENNKKRNGYDVGKAQVGTEAISIFNNKIIRPRGVTISPEQIAEIENQTKAPASEYFEAQLNAGKAIIITKIISPPGTKGDVVVEVTVLENNEAFINDYINLNWYTENESIKNSEQEVREKYIEGLTFLIKRYIAESKINNPPQDGTEFEPDFSFTKSIYDDNELDLNNIMSEVDAIEEKISKDQASKIGSTQKNNAFDALENIYNQVDTIINKPNATNEELQQAIELVKKHAFLIGSFKYNASIGIDLTDDEETKLNKAEAKLSDYLAFFLRNTEIDFNTDIENYNDLVETLTEEELAEFPILEFQDGMLISDNVIDQVLKLKAGKTVVVHSLLFPAVFSKDTNDLLVDPEVQIMSFTPDQIAAIKANPDQYKKKFADVINEKYNKPKPPKGKKPPASPPSPPPAAPPASPPSGGVPAFNGNYTIKDPVLPESTDFLREIMLINTENDKAYNHIDKFFRTLKLDKYSYTDLLQIFGFSSLAEIKRATTNEIESINSSVRSTAAEDIVFIKLQRSVNLNYNQRKAIDVQPGNTRKNIIVVAKKVGDKLIPIGELEYYNAFVDQQGNPLGPRPSSISTVIAPMYEEAYNTVKSIWDNATLGVPYTPNNVSTIFYPKKLTQNMLVSELIDNGYTDIYAMFGQNVFKYNKEDKLWVANNEMFGDLLLTRDEQEFTNNNIIFVKIGTTYHILPINSKLKSNARLKKGEADVAKIFQIAYDNHQKEVENLFGYSTLEEIENKLGLTRKNASNIKAGLDFKNNNFRYPFFIPQVNNSNNMIVRESDNENIYLSHEIGDLRIRIFKKNGKYIIRGGVKQKGKPDIGFEEFSLGNRFNIELYLQGIKTVVSNFHKQELLKDVRIGENIKINIKSEMSINGLTVSSVPSPALRIELSAVANAKAPQAPPTEESLTLVKDVQGIMANAFTGEQVGDFQETSMFFPSLGVNEEMEKVNTVSVNKALRVLLYDRKIYIRGENKKGDPVYIQSKAGPVVDKNLINTLRQQEDSLVVGYVTAAVRSDVPYYVNKQGKVTSGITGKAVYDTPSSKTTRENISDAISTINDFAKNADKVKGSVAYRPATEEEANKSKKSNDLSKPFVQKNDGSGLVDIEVKVTEKDGIEITNFITYTTNKQGKPGTQPDKSYNNFEEAINELNIDLEHEENEAALRLLNTLKETQGKLTVKVKEIRNDKNKNKVAFLILNGNEVSFKLKNDNVQSTETVNAKNVKKYIGQIKTNEEDIEDSPFATANREAVQEDISKAKEELAKIVPFDVEEMSDALQNMLNDGTAIGAFHKNTIYLLEGGVAYHEAFHGVFRTLMSESEVVEVLRLAKQKYEGPTLEDINKLRNLTAHNQKLTTQQLIDLYYEEKLADDFQNYMDTGKSFFARFWRKIIDFLRKFFRHEQDLYTVFRGIEVGNYAKATTRSTAPYAFTPPAYATLKSLRTNNDNEVVEHYVSKKLSLSIAGKVFSNLMKQNANLSEITNEDFQIAVATTRDEFDPSVWYRYFVDNNVEGIKSKMMMIIDFYNSLLPENNEMYFYGVDEETGEEGLFVVDATDSSMIKGNLDFVSEHAKKMISMYSGEVYDELEENEEAEEDTNLPDEMIRKDSNRYGGFKSESQAFKLFIGTTTIDKELFKLDGIADKKVVEMPIDAQRVYSKINRILSGKKPSDFMGILEFAAKDDIELSAFVEKMKKEIKKELSIVNDKDFLLKETTSNIYHNSPTWNLMIKTFYKTNHDYMHSVTKKELEGGTIINYFPNRKNYADWTYNNWTQAFKRLETNNADVQKALNDVKNLIKYYKTKSPNDKEQSIRSIEKILSDKLGISLSKGYIRYSLEKDGVPGIDKLNIDKLTIDLLVNIGNGINSKLDEKSEKRHRRIFNDKNESLLKKLAIASTYFDDKNTSFMLRTPDGELAYTSLYNSYDTEMSAVLKDSFDKNGFNFDLLADNLRKLSYPEYVVKRFVSMAKLNPMFAREDLTPDDFNIIYSFGLETNNYSDLEQVDRDYFKVRAYLSNPSGYDTKTRRMFNPIIIEAKNTNKLIPFTYFKRPVTKEDGMFAFSEDVVNSMLMFARIELTSILSYYNDIDKITKVSPVNVPGKGEVMISAGIPMFVNEFHYNEYVIDGESKIVIQDRNGKFYTVEPVYDEVTYSSHHELVGYQVNEIQQPVGFKQPKGAKMFQFEGVREEILAVQSDVGAVKGILLRWLRSKMQEEIDTNYIKRLFDKVSYEVEGEDADTKYNERRALEFFINDLIASMSYQYMLYGGSPTFNHKDYVDITKRNAGVNASGPNIGNTKTKVAILEDNSTTLTDPSISKNNEDTEMITQDGQSYATALWYFSKFAKYKSVIGLKDIGLKIVAGVKLNSREKKILAKNNMLLISRKGVIRNTFLYNKTSIHIQAREAISTPLYEPEVLLNAWSEYLLDPTPERYNKMIVPMYVAKPGFEYHHNMLNSMEAQGIDITMMLSASKMTSFNIAKDPVRLQGFFIDDKFIKEQVKTDNIKTNITDPTQALALLAYEQSSEFQEYGYKFLEALSKRSELTNNVNMQEFFPDGVVDYELIWSKIKETLSITDPHLYELLDVENGVPKYNWNLPNVNNRVIASFASMMSKNGPKHKNKGTKASLVSSYGYGSQLNWKTELEDYPGVYFSEVYVTQYFLDKMGLKVGDIMWGTRIPTEDKYSMGNMVIKGVVEGPYAMSIFLPNELMFLSGADFDLDAMYIKALNNPKGRELLKAVFDKSRSIDDIIKEFEEETDKDNIKLLDDIITFLSLTLTHNSGNQDIYSTAASTDLIGKSRVRSRDVSQKSSVSFFDRSKAEASNTLAKYGIGPAAVANIAYQKLYISDPESYPLTNKEGIRINRINATHIAGMTDDAKKQIMSRYGLSDENINDILAFMLYYDTTYTQALAAVRDFNSLITSNDFNMSFLNTMRDNMTPQEFAASIAAYEQEGYTVERNEEGIAIRMYMVPDSPANIIKNVKDLKNYMRIVGTVIRLNRKMPATASEYFVLEKSLRSSGVVVQRKYADKGSKAYNEAMSFLGRKSFVTIGDKVFVNTGNEVVILTYSIRQDFSNKYKGDLYNMIIEDDVIRTELGAYLAYGEFNKKVFIKYKPMFRLLSDKVGELVSSLKNDIEIAILNDFDNRDIEAIERNIDDYVLAALNAMSYIDTYNKKIYTEVFYDSMPNGESYMNAVSTRILQEDFVKLLYDTKYEKLEDGTHHITISTINDETDGLKTEYSNDYTNLYNSSRNWAVMDDFIAAEDKQAFINALDINDAKLLMAMMIFNYTMTKDAMMYTPTSFSKIIDPRLFVKYGKASSDIAEAFNSFTSYKNYYDIELVNQHMDILSGKIYGSLLNYLSGQKGKRAFTIVKDHTKQDLNTEKVTAYYAAPGTGKTMLAKKYPGQFMDMDTVVENAFKRVYGRSFDPGTHSLLLNIVMQNATVGAIKMADDVAAELELDPAKMFKVVEDVRKTIYVSSNRNKFLFSAYKADKMRIFGEKMEYKAYYVPAIENVVSFVDKIMERDSDSFLADKTRFKTKKEATEFYLEYYVKPYSYNAIIVGDNLEDTIRSEDIEKDKREANDSGKYISYQGNEYLVIGYDKDIIVYDDNRKRIRPDKAMKLFLSQAKDFADKRSVAFTFNGKDYYTNFDKVIYSVTDNEIVKDAEKELVEFARDKYNKYFAISKGVKLTYKSSKSNDRKTYYVIGDRILNERFQEVFVKDSVDRNKILLNAKKVKDDLVTVTKDGVQYLVDRNGVIASKENGKRLTLDEDLAKEVVSLANDLFAEKDAQPEAEMIYKALPKKTETFGKGGKVYPISKYQNYKTDPSVVYSMRIDNSTEHFGNPFSHDKELVRNYKLIQVADVKEAVIKYTEWVLSEETDINPEQHAYIREQLMSGKLKGKKIIYYKELNEPSHANALDYLINQYSWSVEQETTEELEEIDISGIVELMSPSDYYDQYHNTFPEEYPYTKEKFIRLAEAVGLKEIHDTIQNCRTKKNT